MRGCPLLQTLLAPAQHALPALSLTLAAASCSSHPGLASHDASGAPAEGTRGRKACPDRRWVEQQASTHCGDPRLTEVASSAGECWGECTERVVIGASGSADGACDRAYFFGYEFDETAPPLRRNQGSLTSAGLGSARKLALDLEDVSLDKTYGCPDCDDGGASEVVLVRRGVRSRHTYESGRPPDELFAADEFATLLMSALRTCKSNELVQVHPRCTAEAAR